MSDEPLGRLEYLRLLKAGYGKSDLRLPEVLQAELTTLEIAWALDQARLKKGEEDRKRAERERVEAPESALEEHWFTQRQFGKTRAAELWAQRHGVELPEIIEIAETEEEMLEAIRKLRNLNKARKGPMSGGRRGGVERKD